MTLGVPPRRLIRDCHGPVRTACARRRDRVRTACLPTPTDTCQSRLCQGLSRRPGAIMLFGDAGVLVGGEGGADGVEQCRQGGEAALGQVVALDRVQVA